MAYYPKSQIETNLYTNGGEFVISSTQEIYKGHYYQVSNGNKYTGKTPEDGPNNLLTTQSPFTIEEIGIDGTFPEKEIVILNVPYESYPNITESNLQYQIPNKISNRNLPPPNQPQPSSKDYESGRFVRYFAKKNNELKYMEINKETHDQLNSRQPDIAWDLYSSYSIIWTLTGDQDKVFLVNKKIVALAEKQNKWYGFSQWFRDNFLKYYLAS